MRCCLHEQTQAVYVMAFEKRHFWQAFELPVLRSRDHEHAKMCHMRFQQLASLSKLDKSEFAFDRRSLRLSILDGASGLNFIVSDSFRESFHHSAKLGSEGVKLISTHRI